MAAMRMGCLFSHRANVQFLHKAQSPYSVNTLAAIAAEAAVAGYGLRCRLRDRSARVAPNASAPVSTSSASHTPPVPRISSSATSVIAP